MSRTCDGGSVVCACPRRDAQECYRVRHNIDLQRMVDGEEDSPDDDHCACRCHEPERDENGEEVMVRIGGHGDVMDEWPEDIRIREFPEAAS